MSTPNTNIIYSIDYSQTQDVTNWSTNSSNPISIVDNKLRLIPDDASTQFEQTFNELDPNNNRIRIRVDLEVMRPVGSTDTATDVVFQFFAGSELVGTGTVCIAAIESSLKAEFHLDRVFKYENLNQNIKMVINVPNGFNNIIDIKDFQIEDFTFCEDNVRLYFIFDEFFETLFGAQSAVFRLNKLKVDENDTLTPLFSQDTANIILDDPAQFLFADADIDGANRVSDDISPKSFNPFSKAWQLTFNSPVPFHGGKPIGTETGNDYGTEVLEFGVDKPQILNSDLNPRNGAIFYDADLTKSFEIDIDIIVNRKTTEVLSDPDYNRTFIMRWDPTNCTQEFYYRDRLKDDLIVDRIVDGFLNGITDEESEIQSVACSNQNPTTGNQGSYTFSMDFGSETGEAGIIYNVLFIPVKFTIEWNGQIFSTGYVGSDEYDQELINLGIPQSEINTSPIFTTSTLNFNKSLADPATAVITVEAPLADSNWDLVGICPTVTPTSPLEIGVGDCSTDPTSWTSVYVDTPDILLYSPMNGDVIYSDAGLTTPFNGGDQTYRMRIPTFPSPTIVFVSFQVSATGVVSGVTRCSLTQQVLSIQASNEDNCVSCWEVRLDVPQGATYNVEFASNFQSPAVYDQDFNNCNGIGLAVIQDGTTPGLTNSATFILGIRALGGTNGGILQSEIDIIVRDGSTFVDGLTLTRTHLNQSC